MNYELIKLKKATILSCVKFTIIVIIFTLLFRYINKSFDSFIENEIVKAFIKTIKIPDYEVNLRNIIIVYTLIIVYSIFEIILNIIAYNTVKKTRNRFISFIFGLIKFCTLSCFSGLDYMFSKKLTDREDTKMSRNNKETFIGHRKETNNTNTNNYEQRIPRKTYPKAQIKRRLGLRIFLAIIAFIVLFIIPIVNILIPYKIITGYKDKAWRFRKFTDMLRRGMSVEQVDSIMYEFNCQDGYNRNNEYVRIYKTYFGDEGKKNKRDFEGITIVFDRNNKIIEMSDSYQRTSWEYV